MYVRRHHWSTREGDDDQERGGNSGSGVAPFSFRSMIRREENMR